MGWLQEEVLRRADIVEVVSEYIPLKKKGANYWALSPFKPEKTPSFAVSPSKQIFKCFASGKGGNVIRFLMEMEGISYGEALRKLARKYGIDLPESGEEQTLIAREKQRYLAVYQAATAFYQAQLSGSPAEAYLLRRGLTPATTTAFGLGYAPPDGSALTQYLLRLGYSEELLLTAGLSARSETTGKLYDRFRDRVIFPIQDEQGAVIAFAGRSLGPGEPKYLNSPDTPFYQKSEILYGLFQARSTLRRGTPPLIVEGYMDVISLHQGGFPQAVATCGTALTEAHLQKLRRYAREVILLYDNDEAGHAATERAITMALSANFFVSVASLSEAKDPDELLQTSGPTAMEKVLAARQSWVAYLSNKLPDAPSPQARYELLEKLGQALQAITDPLLQRSYIEEIKEKLDIPPDFWQGYLYAERFARQPHPFNRQRITAEKELLRMILTYPTLSYGGIPLWQLLQEEFRHLTFSEPEGEAVRQAICEASPTEPPTLSVLTERISPEVQDWLTALLMERYTLSSHWRTWDDSPLEEDPLIIVETNLNLLHLQHLQRLLEENLSILQRLSPDDPTYAEHLSLHQVLLRQRATLAHQQGVILPYRTLPPHPMQ